MGLPGHRRTSSDKRRRAAHFALKETSLQTCAKCSKPVKPHHACAFCGSYKGKVVIKTASNAVAKTASKPSAAKKPAPKKAKAAPKTKAKKTASES